MRPQDSRRRATLAGILEDIGADDPDDTYAMAVHAELYRGGPSAWLLGAIKEEEEEAQPAG